MTKMSDCTALFHELNQPLAAILSNAQAVLRALEANKIDARELREIMRDIVADDKRAADVVKRLGAVLKDRNTRGGSDAPDGAET